MQYRECAASHILSHTCILDTIDCSTVYVYYSTSTWCAGLCACACARVPAPAAAVPAVAVRGGMPQYALLVDR